MQKQDSNNSESYSFYSPNINTQQSGIAGGGNPNTDEDFINVYFDLQREVKLSKAQDIGFHIPQLMH